MYSIFADLLALKKLLRLVSFSHKPTKLKNDKTNDYDTFLTIFAKAENPKSNEVDVFLLSYERTEE